MDKQKTFLLVGNGVLLVALALGCDAAEPGAADDDRVVLRPGSGGGGVWLNTNAIGTHAFSEIDLKEAAHDGVRLVRVRVRGPNGTWPELERVEFAGGQLRGELGGTHYSGASLVDSKWDLKLVKGATEAPTTMWISAYEEAEPGELRYTFHYTDGSGAAIPLCDPDPSGDIAAVPIQDITVDDATGEIGHRPDTLYLGCTSGAIGKAVVWGYKPWERGLDEYEAAVRMVRADYCYDGKSWTVPGTPIELRDRWDINEFLNEDHPSEAIWGEHGVLCLATPRNVGYLFGEVTCAGAALPACAEDAELGDDAGALFWSKTNPQ